MHANEKSLQHTAKQQGMQQVKKLINDAHKVNKEHEKIKNQMLNIRETSALCQVL